jgi:hypothetical protein
LAYLQGTADEAQREEVQKALLSSRLFKRELLELGADLDQLDLDGARDLFDAVPEPSPPASRSPLDRSWLRLNWIAGVVSAAAVAVVILVSGRQPSAPAAPWIRVPIEIQPEVFVPVTPRGPEPERKPHAREIEAAFARFQEQVAWENGSLRLQPVPGGPAGDDLLAPHLVQLLGGDDRILVEYPVSTGSSTVGSAAAAPSRPGIASRAWLLSLPDLNLYNAPMDACTLRVSLPSSTIRRGCLTLTYPVPGGYLATEAGYFDMNPSPSGR